MGDAETSQDKRIDDIHAVVNQMNSRGLENARAQGRMEGAIETIQRDLSRVVAMAHSPQNCPTTAAMELEIKETKNEASIAHSQAAIAEKKADDNRRKLERFAVGKGMTRREKWGLAGIGTAIITLAEVVAKVFGK